MSKISSSAKYVYLFGNKKTDGDGSMKPLLGGKGANLAEMTRIGLPVRPVSPSPPRFALIITKIKNPIRRNSPPKFTMASPSSKASSEKNLATWKNRCSCPSAPARAIRCPA
jgi:hypothetical protein